MHNKLNFNGIFYVMPQTHIPQIIIAYQAFFIHIV